MNTDPAADEQSADASPTSRTHAAARRADRAVYLASHPVLFALLAATRHRPLLRVGRTVLVHHPEAYREILTRVPLDRTAEHTTGGTAARLTGTGLLFDQSGSEHRGARRELAALLGSDGVTRLRPLWQPMLDGHLGAEPVDLVPLARRMAGATAAALTGSTADPVVLAAAAERAAAATARAHLPSPLPRPGTARRARRAADELTALLPDPRDAMLAVAAVNTTLAALPRAAAWCARAGLWARTGPELTADLLRLTAASPVLPRVAAADAVVLGHRLRRGDRLLLVARHAAEAHRDTPADPRLATQAPFGLGPHACPGAALARAQLTDLLDALAPYRPRVRHAEPARHSALPSYRRLVLEPSVHDPAPTPPAPTAWEDSRQCPH
ncbi:cytochrome P450 [Kitasatospora sp. NPDC049285]|uniref:cytochrome P450 n=1 Tax=Kitasatospora sp. NPDC049285 TaxID=3157096 RepID=UPI00342544E8